ncbi:MAG: 1-acyl-sn-glycerol-3-phosphate acyltransferase [Acidobacteria bacterium]|nr:1-acyl-sn-glycerol-3-phosphate acyltransferase [Acidobacteriota bacterium]
MGGFLRALFLTDPYIIVSTIAFGTVSLVVSLFESTGRGQLKVARVWARWMLKVAGVEVRVVGLEKLDPSRNYIFAANHLSYMDTPVVLGNIPVEFRFMAKRGLFSIPFLGTHLKSAGHIPVPLDNPRAAVRSMTDAGRTIREKGISVLIFPEGGRAPDGVLQPFKEGGAFIAIKAGVPVVPVALVGTREILPFGAGFPRPGLVTLRIGEARPAEGLAMNQRGEFTNQLREDVVSLLAQGHQARP